uniref:Uncharacterized protein n=1 Tax=Panagrolaimus sp. ES5 TaxID=591445 RepID=A0AC34GS39_9BILA
MSAAVPSPQKPRSICTIFFDRTTRQPQYFPFPKPIIDYITLASSKTYKKLIKTCKYFYATKPILILCLHYNDKNVRDWTCSPYGKCYLYHSKVDLDKIKAKIWVTTSLDVYGYYQGPADILSSLIPKLYHSDIAQLELANQIINFDEFLFLTPNVKEILFRETIVKMKNGTVVQLEDIVANLPKLEKLI